MVQILRRACGATLLALGMLAVNTPSVAAATNPAKADYEAAALTVDEVNTTLAPIQVADNGSGAIKAGVGPRRSAPRAHLPTSPRRPGPEDGSQGTPPTRES